jgi:hypothetical protein
VRPPDRFGPEGHGRASGSPFAGDAVLDRIVRASAADAAAMVLDLPEPVIRTALTALGPREVARLLLGVRADRLADLLAYLPDDLLSAVLAQLTVAQLAEFVPLVPVESAVRVVTHLPADVASELLLALPTPERLALQRRLPPPSPPGGGYRDQVAQAVRRATGTVTVLDRAGRALLTEVFGRPVQILVRDRPGTTFGAGDVAGVVGATDWRRVAGLVVVTNAALDPALAAGLREARTRGYVVEVVAWQDDRDDGLLKRTLVRLGGQPR